LRQERLVFATRRAHRHIANWLRSMGFPVTPHNFGTVTQHLYYGASSAIMAPCPVFRSKTSLKTPIESCASERRARISPYRNTFEAV
jgi:hypothetical protein